VGITAGSREVPGRKFLMMMMIQQVFINVLAKQQKCQLLSQQR